MGWWLVNQPTAVTVFLKAYGDISNFWRKVQCKLCSFSKNPLMISKSQKCTRMTLFERVSDCQESCVTGSRSAAGSIRVWFLFTVWHQCCCCCVRWVNRLDVVCRVFVVGGILLFSSFFASLMSWKHNSLPRFLSPPVFQCFTFL